MWLHLVLVSAVVRRNAEGAYEVEAEGQITTVNAAREGTGRSTNGDGCGKGEKCCVTKVKIFPIAEGATDLTHLKKMDFLPDGPDGQTITAWVSQTQEAICVKKKNWNFFGFLPGSSAAQKRARHTTCSRVTGGNHRGRQSPGAITDMADMELELRGQFGAARVYDKTCFANQGKIIDTEAVLKPYEFQETVDRLQDSATPGGQITNHAGASRLPDSSGDTSRAEQRLDTPRRVQGVPSPKTVGREQGVGVTSKTSLPAAGDSFRAEPRSPPQMDKDKARLPSFSDPDSPLRNEDLDSNGVLNVDAYRSRKFAALKEENPELFTDAEWTVPKKTTTARTSHATAKKPLAQANTANRFAALADSSSGEE